MTLMRIVIVMLMSAGLLWANGGETIIDAEFVSATNKLQPGANNPVAVQITVHHPWHINAHVPSDDFLIPTEVSFGEVEGLSFGAIDYPLAEEKEFAFSENPVAVYEGTVYAYTTVTASADLAGQTVEVKGVVSYQACNDATCLPPDEVQFSAQVAIAAAGETVGAVNQGLFGTSAAAPPDRSAGISATDDLAGTIESQGLFWAFIAIFIAGLALNLTPCVYPLIPITISYFGGQAGGNKGNLLLMSLIYVVGMAITYSVLGLFAALTGSILGVWLQNPWVLMFIAAVMVALALGMFGVYEIRVPTALANFAGQSKQGYFGTFFMGLTVGIIAAPCIGPFVIGLLTYVGEKGDPVMGFLMFFVLALGLGTPFIVLAVFGGALNHLPRSGGWMNWVKKVFGFILIGMAFYFINPLIPDALWYYSLLAIAAFAAGIYLAWIDPTEGKGKIFGFVKNGTGIVFMSLAALFLVSGVNGYVNEKLASYTPEHVGAPASDHILWSPYSEEKLAEARDSHLPVMIDFYADWCIPCKELDKFTFTDKQVIALSRNFVMLKADLTKTQSPDVQALQKKYNIKGVPTLVFLDNDGAEIRASRVVSFVKAEKFVTIMEGVLQHSSGQASGVDL